MLNYSKVRRESEARNPKIILTLRNKNKTEKKGTMLQENELSRLCMLTRIIHNQGEKKELTQA